MTLLARASSVTGTLFGRPVLDAWLVLMPPTMMAIWLPALNVCSMLIVGNRRRYLSVIVTGVSAACW